MILKMISKTKRVSKSGKKRLQYKIKTESEKITFIKSLQVSSINLKEMN
jgi:hypothetical protein